MPFLKKIELEAAEVGFQSPIVSSLIKAKEQQERVRQELILMEQAKIRAQEQEPWPPYSLSYKKSAIRANRSGRSYQKAASRSAVAAGNSASASA